MLRSQSFEGSTYRRLTASKLVVSVLGMAITLQLIIKIVYVDVSMKVNPNKETDSIPFKTFY